MDVFPYELINRMGNNGVKLKVLPFGRTLISSEVRRAYFFFAAFLADFFLAAFFFGAAFFAFLAAFFAVAIVF